MKQNVVDVFERTNQNFLAIVQDSNGCSYGVQKSDVRERSLKLLTSK